MIKNLFIRGRALLLTSIFVTSTFVGSVNVAASTAYTGMRNITSQQIVNEMKLGWNLGNSLDASPTETSWSNPKTTHAMIDKIKAAGFNTVRIPVTWDGHMGSAPNYTIDSAWMSRVEEVINYVLDNNMYAIVDSHHDTSWQKPFYANKTQAMDQITKVWTQIANRFKNYSDYLIFEALNEPRPVGASNEWSGGSYENRDVINSYNLAAVNAIRKTSGNNAKRFIMVPTVAASATSVAVNDLVIPNNDSNVIVSLHMYSPYFFTMDTSATGISTWGSSYDKSQLDSELDAVYNKFVRAGRAVVIGEMGSTNKNNTSSRVALAEYYVKAARARGITPIWWDNGYYNVGAENFGIFNRNSLTWVYPEIVQALVKGTGIPVATPTPTATPKPTATPTPTPTATPRPTATPTPTATPRPTATPTVTPKPTATPIPTPIITNTGKIQVKMFNTSTSTTSNTISVKYLLTNTGSTAINLSNVKVKYYYTIDGEQAQSFWCDWSTVGSANVTGKMVKMTTAKTNADYYLETGFTSAAGTLNPGSSIEIQGRMAKTNWSNYTQTNDYSFNSTASSYTLSNKVTAFISNSLSFGIEP